MRNFQLICAGLDPIPLLLAIKRRGEPGLWREDTYLRDYPQGPFGDTETIMLRFPAKRVAETEAELAAYGLSDSQHESIEYPNWHLLPEAHPIVFGLMASVKATRLGRVMINRVRPGGRIARHADTPAHTEYYTRFHFVLQSSPGALLHCGSGEAAEVSNYLPGTVFWFNNKLEHEVVNNGSVDRIHMVMDCKLVQAQTQVIVPAAAGEAHELALAP